MNESVRQALPDLHLKNRSLKASPRKVLSDVANLPGNIVEMTHQQKASVLFDMAVIRMGVKNLWIAKTLGVSEAAVSKWRSPDYREGPSWVQIVALGEEFQYALKKESEKHFGWSRRAFLDLVGAVENLAEAVNE